MGSRYAVFLCTRLQGPRGQGFLGLPGLLWCPQNLEQSFFIVSAVDSLDWIDLCCGGSPGHCRMFNSIPGFYLLKAIASLLQLWHPKICTDAIKCPWDIDSPLLQINRPRTMPGTIVFCCLTVCCFLSLYSIPDGPFDSGFCIQGCLSFKIGMHHAVSKEEFIYSSFGLGLDVQVFDEEWQFHS